MHTKYRLNEFHDIIEALCVDDGSCRDMNFERPTWEGVRSFMETLRESFRLAWAQDHEGRDVAELVTHVESGLPSGALSISAVFEEGKGLFRTLQVFVSAEDNGSPFIELTFFPEYIVPTATLRERFIEWIEKTCDQLEARRCYARYENASWALGDVSAESGVFLASSRDS